MQIIVNFTRILFISLTSFSLIYTHKVSEEGDILLGGLFPIHQKGITIHLCMLSVTSQSYCYIYSTIITDLLITDSHAVYLN